jgi:hypothetical protein
MIKCYENKTLRFLVPCLTRHGTYFIVRFNEALDYIIKIGIHDTALKEQYMDRKKVCMLLKMNITIYTHTFLMFMRKQPFFITDYDFEKHEKMILFEVPPNYFNTYDSFIIGDYEKMYTIEDITSLRFKEKDRNILMGTNMAKLNFIDELGREFRIAMKHHEVKPPFELPLKFEDELFNANSKEIFITKDNYLPKIIK